MKIPTPTGHAFVLRRFDTGAISLTTMYRAAFPSCTEADEKLEMAHVKDNFNLFGQNGSSKEPHIVRLAGIWVSAEVARQFATSYKMEGVVEAMVAAHPDVQTPHRRSTKATPKKAAAAPSTQESPAAKRRKESSPAAAAAPSAPAPAALVVSPTRRSTRARSPPPSHVPQTISAVISTTTSANSSPTSTRKSARKSAVAAASSTQGVIDEDAAHVAENAGPDMAQDIAEQKSLIADLKAQRAAASSLPATTTVASKRAREDEEDQLAFNFKGPEEEAAKAERTIATNRRVLNWGMVRPQNKAVAWGALAFAVGMGAM